MPTSAADVSDLPLACEIIGSDYRVDVKKWPSLSLLVRRSRLRRAGPGVRRPWVPRLRRRVCRSGRVLELGQAAPLEWHAHHLGEGAHCHGMIAAQQE